MSIVTGFSAGVHPHDACNARADTGKLKQAAREAALDIGLQ